MGIFDKAKDLASQHSDKVDGAVEKGGDMFDEKTGDKYADQTDMAQDKVGDFVGGDSGNQPADRQN